MQLASSVALPAVFEAVGGGGTSPVTFGAGDIGVELDLAGYPGVGLFEGHRDGGAEVGAPGGPAALAPAPAPSHVVKDRFEDGSKAEAASAKAAESGASGGPLGSWSVSVAVVESSFLVIAEDAVGLVDLSELLLSVLLVFGDA